MVFGVFEYLGGWGILLFGIWIGVLSEGECIEKFGGKGSGLEVVGGCCWCGFVIWELVVELFLVSVVRWVLLIVIVFFSSFVCFFLCFFLWCCFLSFVCWVLRVFVCFLVLVWLDCCRVFICVVNLFNLGLVILGSLGEMELWDFFWFWVGGDFDFDFVEFDFDLLLDIMFLFIEVVVFCCELMRVCWEGLLFFWFFFCWFDFFDCEWEICWDSVVFFGICVLCIVWGCCIGGRGCIGCCECVDEVLVWDVSFFFFVNRWVLVVLLFLMIVLIILCIVLCIFFFFMILILFGNVVIVELYEVLYLIGILILIVVVLMGFLEDCIEEGVLVCLCCWGEGEGILLLWFGCCLGGMVKSEGGLVLCWSDLEEFIFCDIGFWLRFNVMCNDVVGLLRVLVMIVNGEWWKVDVWSEKKKVGKI